MTCVLRFAPVLALALALALATLGACTEPDRLGGTPVANVCAHEDASVVVRIDHDDAAAPTYCPACQVCPTPPDGGEPSPLAGRWIQWWLRQADGTPEGRIVCWGDLSYSQPAIDAVCEDCIDSLGGGICQFRGLDFSILTLNPVPPACPTDDSWCEAR